jgi:hypothetical protein
MPEAGRPRQARGGIRARAELARHQAARPERLGPASAAPLREAQPREGPPREARRARPVRTSRPRPAARALCLPRARALAQLTAVGATIAGRGAALLVFAPTELGPSSSRQPIARPCRHCPRHAPRHHLQQPHSARIRRLRVGTTTERFAIAALARAVSSTPFAKPSIRRSGPARRQMLRVRILCHRRAPHAMRRPR